MTASTSNHSISTAARPRRRYLVCAAEPRPAYLPTRQESTSRPDGSSSEAAGDGSPTETVGDGGLPGGQPDGPVEPAAGVTELTTRLPVLAEVPDLADALTDLAVADAAVRRAVIALGRLDEALEVEKVTGVGLEHWLALACRQSRLDRRTLLRTARWTRRLPAFAEGIETGALSWAQARTLTLVLRDLPAGHDRQADQLLGQLVATLPDDADPDAIADQLRRAFFRWRDELTPDHDPVPGNRLTIQPRLDGTGGTFHGDADAIGLAILDDATAPRRDQLDHPGGVAGARADNLLARLLHHCPDQPDGRGAGRDPAGQDPANRDSPGEDPANRDPAGEHPAGQDPGTRHLDSLQPNDLAAKDEDGRAAGGLAAGGPAADGAAAAEPTIGPLPPVVLLARLDLDTALDTGRFPLELLTRLLGGRLQVTTAAARRLLDTHGTRLRTVLVDNGTVVGVGRATRIPPGWLTDALLAIHDTCTGPVCDRPARGSDVDHARPWWPVDDRPGGTTDLDDLGPLCADTNRAKETAGWRAQQAPDGLRRWRHPHTGLTTTSVPSTWRPPPGPPATGQPPDRTRAGPD
jgi:hypothetical protein